MQIETDDTTFLLQEWGRWAFVNQGLHLGYPSMTPTRRLMKTTSSAGPLISDLCAQGVDYAVSQVCAANDEIGAALVNRYLLRKSYRRIGETLGCSPTRAQKLVQIGEATVGEVLDGD